MHSRLLITGLTGFVGAALCERTIHHGLAINGAVRRGCDAPNGFKPFVVGDINEATAWTDALRDVNAVVHLAARVHVMAAVHSSAAMRAAAVSGVKRFVFISSVKVNGEATQQGQAFTETDVPAPQDAYALTKHEAEQCLRQLATDTGMEVVIIRPPLVYGPGVKANFASLIRAVQRGWPLPLGAVHNQRSFVALDNLVDLIVNCITHPQDPPLTPREFSESEPQASGVSAPSAHSRDPDDRLGELECCPWLQAQR